ncbi:hypothetical protein HN018_05515 [Lichenicola cladoniae]|uniref:ABC transmembrane type-1 domain-containing protein n=1 Tax=Lichenicola cladoniae TaxID=1484109 RepID=A0A6M8HMH1_9PROT|nr:hypothetical protein [Lichenicola cladoniae]NPD67029.1 hypothetical protein [Acetobacteraceae bacterium]QKE89574.1 hypothetical protein HN018_05515 [Lichenicola cladoniae]
MSKALRSTTALLVVLLLTVPLARFLLLPFFPAFGPAHSPPPSDPDPLAPALVGSALLAFGSAALATPLALWLGLLLEQRQWRGNGMLTALLWLIFLMPGYLVASGWEVLLAQLTSGVGVALRHALLGWPGFVAFNALKGLPPAILACRAGWASLELILVDSARLHVHRRASRWLLNARTMLPFASVSFVIVFVESMQDFGLAATLGGQLGMPLLVAEVYRGIAAWPVSWPRAARAADLLVLLSAVAILLRVWLGTETRAPVLIRSSAQRRARPSSRERCFAAAAMAAVALLGVIVPLTGFAADVLTVQETANLQETSAWQLPQGSWRALCASLLYGASGAFLALLLACALLAIGSRSRAGRIAMLVPMANMAVPGVVLGAAWVITFGAPPLVLTGTPFAMLLASAVSQLPVLLLLLGNVLASRHSAFGDAARVNNVGLLDRLELIHLPPLLRPLAWGWSLAFVRIFFDLPLAMLLAPAGGEPVGVLILQLQHGLHFGPMAFLGLVSLALCGSVVTLVCASIRVLARSMA